ncbi:hypothetical protein L6164_001989 [Bauhinia variegata]|uniref:Uncharacterized protein n=1 Tax=Bauhinia variegata TaxID=167791 RepID=A0ACB9PXD3_BAUVA|nr:hypothetical protein L6164_001989 [Bauhinia variegata]
MRHDHSEGIVVICSKIHFSPFYSRFSLLSPHSRAPILSPRFRTFPTRLFFDILVNVNFVEIKFAAAVISKTGESTFGSYFLEGATMEVLISIAAKIAEYTVAPIGRQVGYVLFYKGNLKELNEAAKELEVARESIKHLVDAEIRNGKEILAVVQDWLKNVDDITEEAKQLWEDPQHANAGCSKWSFPDLKSRHQLSRKAKKMVKRVADVNQKRNFDIDSISYLPALQIIRPSTALRSNERFESRHSVMKQIMRALADSKLSKIGVYGLGGVGKTTLMKEIAAKVRDDKLFDAVVMAFVTKSPDITRIQDEIADQLGLQFGEKSSFGRACRLHDRIEREKSILIILDDLCTKLDLEEVGIPFRDAQEYLKREMKSIHPGCKLLLTSINGEVLQEMKTEKNFRLEVLNQTETWSLFADMVGDAIRDPSLRSIAIDVAKKCNGLPVLITTIARAVRNKGIDEWKEAIKKLERVDNTDAYLALEFCYNSLGSNEVKALFLLCGIVGPSVEVEYLLKCAMGLGMFKDITTMEGARKKLREMIVALQASCLLLESDTTVEVKMHDIVREVAISIAHRDQHVYIAKEGSKSFEWPTQNFLKKCSIIKLKWCPIHTLPKKLHCPKIKFLLLESGNRFLEIPTLFFEGMRNLKVLDLTAMNLISFPTSFLSLTNLQTLCLDQCALEDITSIGALKNLEILSLIHSSITKFPSEIAELINLKMLDLSNSGIEVIPSNIISKLTKLEELYMGNTSIKWEHENSVNEHKNASLAELRQLPNLTALDLQIPEAWMLPRDLLFGKLERYKIFIGDVWEWSGKYESSKTLKLKLHTSIHLEHGIKLLLRIVEDLHLDELSGISNVLFELNGEGFPCLKHLYIQNNAEIKYIVDSIGWIVSEQSFPKLETLTLQNLNNLEKICHGQLMVNSFSNLKEIKIKSCDRLRYLISCSMANQLPQLLELEVSECKSMKTILHVERDASVDGGTIEFHQLRSLALQSLPLLDEFYSDELKSPTIVPTCKQLVTYIQRPLFSKKVVFLNLETLKLSSINLKKIWEGNSSATFVQNLTHLTVEDCGALKYLFSTSKVSNFPKLKWLEIRKCHMMEEIMETTSNVVFSEVQFLKLEKIIINDMQNLKTIWHPASSFGELKTLEVKSCPRLANVFPSYMQRKFGNLETLTVSDCDSMEVIFQLDANETFSEEDRTELKSMTLCRLPKLKQIWSREPQGILSFHSLQLVNIQICWELEYIFPFSIAANLHLLEELFLDECGLTFVVERKDGQMEGKPVFVLKSLKSLYLWNLKNLKGFYAGIHNLSCSSLKEIYVFGCYKLRIFKTMSTSEIRYLDDIVYGRPLFSFEEVMPNLEQLTLRNEDASIVLDQLSRQLFSKLKVLRVSRFENEEATFPYWFLQNIQALEMLAVEYSSFNEIFQDEKHECGEGNVESSTQLKELRLRFCSSKCLLRFKLLEKVVVKQCPRMNTFSNGSTSAVKLRKVQIEESDDERYWEVDLNQTIRKMHLEKVAFHGFKLLELSEYPELKELWYDGPYSHGGHHIFANLKSLRVKKCDFLSDVIFSSNLLQVLCNLEELEVTDCASLEALIDVKGVNGKEMQMKEISQLKKFKLSGLPNLKHIWNKETHRIISFKNLLTVDVVDCENLESLFPVSLSKDLVQLQEVDIESSGLVEIFSTEDGLEECRFDFPQLTKLRLWNLTKLKCFYRGRHILDCPSLKNLNIYHCGTLQTFSFGHSVFQQANGMGEDEFPQALFPLEKVCTKLELMTLNGNDMKRIANDNFEESLFDKIVDLRIQCFHETHDDFPIDFLQRFPNLVTLWVRCCSFNSLFPLKGVGHQYIGAPLHIRELILYKMEQLKYIWEEDILSSGHAETLDSLPSSISVKNLTILQMEDCKELVYLLTKSVAKSLLQLKIIYIENCESMVDVVKNDEEAAEEIITFKNLERLTLISLSSLKSFCSGKQTFIFPSLVGLKVKGCPKMNIFSSGVVTAPLLQSVTVEDEREHWKGDLNTTILQLFNGKVIRDS